MELLSRVVIVCIIILSILIAVVHLSRSKNSDFKKIKTEVVKDHYGNSFEYYEVNGVKHFKAKKESE